MRPRLAADPGGVLIEFAVILPVILLLVLGAFEYGMLLRDSLTVSTAAREGGRVAAATANYGQADCVVLEAAAGALQSIETGEIDEIRIYKSDGTGSVPPETSPIMRRYSPFQSGDPSLIACTGSEWNAEHLGAAWDPSDRVNDERNADWIGVEIQYSHTFRTGFLWFTGSAKLADRAVRPPPPQTRGCKPNSLFLNSNPVCRSSH